MKKSVVVVEADRGLREQLVGMLGAAADFKCAGAFDSAETALPKILAAGPDAVLLDFRLPGVTGLQCLLEIKKRVPAAEVVMLTVKEDSERIFQALKAGASGCLLRARAPEQFLAALREVCAGGVAVSGGVARKLVEQLRLQPESGEELDRLSPREREVLDLLALGNIYKEVGELLGIGVETVRTHVKSICQKMRVRNRLEAIARRRANTR